VIFVTAKADAEIMSEKQAAASARITSPPV
jgi:hypothetical protein